MSANFFSGGAEKICNFPYKKKFEPFNGKCFSSDQGNKVPKNAETCEGYIKIKSIHCNRSFRQLAQVRNLL